ncbi:MAG: hypothetical protein ACREND_12200 [Gemmatimonadaceae bacterium]
MKACSICGKGVPFYRDCHPACARQVIRAEAKRHWDQVRAEQASGEREVIGATIFVFDGVKASRGHGTERVKLSTLCWVYHRQISHWTLPVPVPYGHTHELVIHAHDGAELTTWKQVAFAGSREEVHQSIAALMKRAPWALYGFTVDARAAMAPGSRLATTREVEARRCRAAPASARHGEAPGGIGVASLDIERLVSFGVRGRD